MITEQLDLRPPLYKAQRGTEAYYYKEKHRQAIGDALAAWQPIDRENEALISDICGEFPRYPRGRLKLAQKLAGIPTIYRRTPHRKQLIECVARTDARRLYRAYQLFIRLHAENRISDFTTEMGAAEAKIQAEKPPAEKPAQTRSTDHRSSTRRASHQSQRPAPGLPNTKSNSDEGLSSGDSEIGTAHTNNRSLAAFAEKDLEDMPTLRDLAKIHGVSLQALRGAVAALPEDTAVHTDSRETSLNDWSTTYRQIRVFPSDQVERLLAALQTNSEE